MNLFFIITVFLLGLVVGSFLNVCICRLPQEKSIVYPPSNCPKCSHRLSAIDLLPIISYIFLRGKCRYCGGSISIRYPIVEALTGFLFLTIYFKFGAGFVSVFYFVFISILIAVAFTDLETQTIHDYLSFSGIIAGLLYGLYSGSLIGSFYGMAIGAGFFFCIRILGQLIYKKEAMGEGDVLLAAMLGAFFGPKGIILSIALSFLIGAIISIVLLATKMKKRGEEIPFGPYLAVSAIIVIFWGETLWRWYLRC
ncbi:MAG: prepilin peptidase [Candidatus Margulisiibacteriota bacterium]